MASNTRKQLEKWLKTIDVNGIVLDIGGGTIPIKGRTKSWDVDDYIILDIKNNADIVTDINYPIELSKKFDNIFCLEVMEYVWNPVTALSNMSRLLKLGGILYISFHFLFPHHDPADKDYLRYTKRGIEKLLVETGFIIEKIVPRETIAPEALRTFCNIESKIYRNAGEIGYLVKAIKKDE